MDRRNFIKTAATMGLAGSVGPVIAALLDFIPPFHRYWFIHRFSLTLRRSQTPDEISLLHF